MPIPPSLQSALAARKVIPFAGAGVSMSVRKKDGSPFLPSWTDLLNAAVTELEAQGKTDEAGAVRLHIRRGLFLEAAQEAKQSLGSGWAVFLRSMLDGDPSDLDADTLRLPEDLWHLAHPLIITTNFDRLLRETCPEKARLNLIDIEGPAEQSDVMRGIAAQPTLWHLHGRIDNLASVILTPDGFERLYGSPNAEVQYRTARAVLQTLLRTHTLLFVGFSFDDRAIGTELHAFAEIMQGAGGNHYAILRREDADRIGTLGLPIEPLVVSDFGQPVLDLLSELRGFIGAGMSGRAPATDDGTPPAVADYDPKKRALYLPFPPKGDGVIGRETDLQAVRKQLVSGRRTSIGQTAAFRGLGGLGKTQLAVEYATRFANEYPSGVVWLTADQNIPAQLIEVADRAGWVSPQSEHRYKLEIALQRLRTFDGGLVIFDNVDSFEVIEQYLPLPEASPHLLLTSRVDIQLFVAVPLNVLGDDEAYALLIREAGRTPEGAEADIARRIAERLGGLPLALELAGSYLARFDSVSFADYADLFEQSVRVLDRGRTGGFTKHDSDLASSLAVHERALEEAPALRDVLNVLTWGAPSPVSQALIGAMLPDVDPVDLAQALVLGSSLRILQPVAGEKRYALHRLVAEVRRAQADLEEAWATATAQRVAAWFRERRDDFTRLSDYEADFDQLDAWRQHVRHHDPVLGAELLWLQAYPAYHRGQGVVANRLVDAALAELEATSGDRELEAHLRHDLSTTLAMMGQHAEALALAEEALAIRRVMPGEQQLDLAQALDNVGSTLQALGRNEEALDVKRQALTIRQANLIGRDPDTAQWRDTARSLGNFGTSLDTLGRNEEALDVKRQALTIRQGKLGKQHPDTAHSLDSIGVTLSNMGQRAEALTLAEQALEIRRAVLGEQHPDTARSLDSVGVTLSNMGRQPKAIEHFRQALDISSGTLGERHPTTVGVLGHLVTALKRNGSAMGALPTIQKRLAGLDKSDPSYRPLKKIEAEVRASLPGARKPRRR